MKKLGLVVMLFSLVLLLSSCMASDSEPMYLDDGDSYSEENTTPDEPAPVINGTDLSGGDVVQTAAIPALENRKIIYTADLSMNAPDPAVVYNQVIDNLDTHVAYVESADITEDRYIVKIRVLSENFTDFVEEIKTSGEIISYTKSSEDVTNSYSTFEARLAALEAQHARILEFIETADDLDTLLELEAARFEIEIELNEVGQALANYDSLVDFSTINLVIVRTTEQEVILPRTDTPLTNIIQVGKNGAEIEVYNRDLLPVTFDIDVYQNGEFIHQYEKTAYGEGKAVVNLGDLESNTEYVIKVTSIANEKRESHEYTIKLDTTKTFWNKVTNIFMDSFNALVSIVEFISLTVVALSPFAVVGLSMFIPAKYLYRKKGYTFLNFKKQ